MLEMQLTQLVMIVIVQVNQACIVIAQSNMSVVLAMPLPGTIFSCLHFYYHCLMCFFASAPDKQPASNPDIALAADGKADKNAESFVLKSCCSC